MRNHFGSGLFVALVAGVMGTTACGYDPRINPELLGAKTGFAGVSVASTRRADLLQATRAFGPLVIDEGEVSATANRLPWSSYWYPLKETDLFQATTARGPSPLEKYDRYVRQKYRRASQAADYERAHYRPDSTGWDGLCDAWAFASLVEPEPSRSVSASGIQFTVRDQKALLLKTYEIASGKREFGERYDGRGEDFADIYPDQFHRLIQTELVERGRAFIIDMDPSYPVWNQPLYRTLVRIHRDATNPRVFHVENYVTWAQDIGVDPDYVGTLGVNHLYTYDLYGEPFAGRSLRVDFGVWTGGSVQDHPDYATLVPDSGPIEHRSRNPEIDPQIVREILAGQ